jgi:hypothetical protein
VLKDIEEAIQLRKEELKQVHTIEATATTLDELEETIRTQRLAWDAEQARWKKDFEEMKSEQRKQWKREDDDYQYQLTIKHRKADDVREAMIAQEDKARREKQEQLDKQWAEREAELKKREQELAELRAFKEAAPGEVRKAESAAAQIAGNSVKKEYETKMQLANKDAEVERRLAEQQILSREDTIKKQQAQIDDLKAQLEQARHDSREIATKALDSASGRATTEALRDMIKEQSSTKSTK